MNEGDKDKIADELASKLLSAVFDDLIMDIALQSHRQVKRSRVVCDICKTKCGLVHVTKPVAPESNTLNSSTVTTSFDGTASQDTQNSTNGNIYFDCTNCGKSIASNRFAPHLSSCRGLTGRRANASRTPGGLSRQNSETRRSGSPYVATDEDGSEDEAPKMKSKGKAKIKLSDESDLKRKTADSSSASPNKKPKKGRPLGSLNKTKANGGLVNGAAGSKARVPSKLRDNSTASLVPQSHSSGSRSRSSSPTSTLSYQRSPSVPSKERGQINEGKDNQSLDSGYGRLTHGWQPSSVNPSRPLPPPPPRVPEPDYMIDVEGGGEETGSSTETDSS